MTIWFTADTHFSHANIIKYCDRPFADAHEMNKTITERWNSVVQKDDVIYHLGDFAFCKREISEEIVWKLNGLIKFIPGNHDKQSRQPRHLKGKFEILPAIHELKVVNGDMSRFPVILCHYPLQSWNRSFHGSWHLHGHAHGTIPSSDHQYRLDVGVDVHNFTPISLEQVKEIMAKKTSRPDSGRR